jgi:hypothetical protein
MIRIAFADILRATLPLRTGNEGWLGFHPTGREYHVVVPVDVQIAKGVMACNFPADGTPFGGYTGWLYFRCPPFDDGGSLEGPDPELRAEAARHTARDLLKWLASYDIEAVVEPDPDTGCARAP